MKTIPKKKLDKLIQATREVHGVMGGELDKLQNGRIATAQELARETGVHWTAFLEVCDCILWPDCLKEDADNDTVYQVLKLLGWDVA